MDSTDMERLIARLLAQRAVPRTDPLARRALTDDGFREDLERRLSACGMQLLDNPYADALALGLKRPVEEAVFSHADGWWSNNVALPRDAVAVLVVLWALLILPKRQRQLERQSNRDTAGQGQMFADERAIPRGAEASTAISERTLLADFAERLGRGRLRTILPMLARFGFIVRRDGMIHEGPLLDLLVDYPVLAPRIVEGALADLLKIQGTRTVDSDDEPRVPASAPATGDEEA
jgi:hypothetical protein